MNEKELISVNEAASILNVSEQWIRSKLRKKEIRGEKVGNSWVIYRKSLPIQLPMTFQEQRPNVSDKNSNEFVALSFFSGALGLDLGLEKAGISFKLACEIDKNCQNTIKLNRPNLPLIDDVSKYSAADIRRIAGIQGNIDLIVGGPPCQAFSTAGARKGFEDARGNVFLHYIDLLLELQPSYIVIENVRGLLSAPLKHVPWNQRVGNEDALAKPGGALLYIIEQLRNGGYTVSFNLYNAANFGVPQIRERVVMICVRGKEKFPYLMPTHSSDPSFGLPPWKTLAESIQNLDQCDAAQFPEKRLKYFRMLKAGQYWKDLPLEIQKEAMGKSFLLGGGKTGFYRRLAWNKPSCTLVTSPTMPATDICHPDQDRPLSIQEYKRIQMFPDDWKLAGKLPQQYKQIGNAVPIGLGYAIGKAILAFHKGNRWETPKDFPFSRYKNTDDVAWEQETRKRLEINCDESLSSKKDVIAATQRLTKK